jgi:lipoprotein signal peptidase
MNQQELEEFAQFLRMAEMSNRGAASGASREGPSWWGTYQAKSFLSIGMFSLSVFLFRNFGHTLA